MSAALVFSVGHRCDLVRPGEARAEKLSDLVAAAQPHVVVIIQHYRIRAVNRREPRGIVPRCFVLPQNLRDSRRDVDGILRIVEQRGGLRTEQMLVMVDVGRQLVGCVRRALRIAGDACKRGNGQPQPQARTGIVGHSTLP